MQQDEKVIQLNIDLLIPNKYQPRKAFDESALNELSNSIKEYGILNPILVTKKEDKYEIIAGERRYRAAKMAGLKEVPVIIKTYEETKMAEIALIENLHRENLNPMEEAKSYQEIMRLSKITQQDLGNKLGKSQAAIANKLRLLNLPTEIQDAVSQKKISERHARSLMRVEDKEEQFDLLNKVINNKMSVKELDNLINQQSITEKEIQDAINEIMKSLNINSEDEILKEEEKESDNMNNGNFFPNFNNTMGNNDVSLNSMNIQSMGGTNIQPVEETVMTTPIQPVETNLTMNNNVMQEPPLFDASFQNQTMNQIDTQPIIMNQPQEMNIPNIGMETPIMEHSQLNQNLDTPLFDANFQNQAMNQMDTQPIIMNQPPEMNIPNTGMEPPIMEQPQLNQNLDTPLFDASFQNTMMNQIDTQPIIMNQPPEMDSQNVMPTVEQETVIPTFEIPINSVQEPVESLDLSTNSVDKLSELISYLEQNSINYKKYSNETGNCIIIEM